MRWKNTMGSVKVEEGRQKRGLESGAEDGEKKQRQKTNSSNENSDFDDDDISEKKNNTYSRSSGRRATQKPKKTTCLFKVSLKYLRLKFRRLKVPITRSIRTQRVPILLE